MMEEQASNMVQVGPIHSHRTISLTRLDKMKHALTGHGRIIVYEAHHKLNTIYGPDHKIKFDPRKKPRANKLVEIREGYFRDGKLEGYGRVMNVDSNAIVGFFEKNVENGKVQYYKNG